MKTSKKTNHNQRAVLVIVAFVVLVLGLWERSAISQQIENAGNVKESKQHWEYQTTKVDSSTLQETLNQLGTQGWEVFSIVRLEAKLVQENGENVIRTTHVQLTAKRLAAKQK